MGPIKKKEHFVGKSLTNDEFESLVTLYDSDLSAIEVISSRKTQR
jgi:hypothetical protein